MVQDLLELGLSNMTREERREWIDRISQGGVIDGDDLAALIDACRTNVANYLEENEDKVPNASQIRPLLEVTGRDIVAYMDTDEIIRMVDELLQAIEEDEETSFP